METLKALLLHQTFMGPVWTLLVAFVAIPVANELVSKYRGTRAASILQGIALVILKTPAVGRVLVKFPVVGDLLYVFAPQDKTGLPTPLIARPGDGPAPPSNPALVLAMLSVFMALPMGCASWKEITRISLTTVERSYVEAATAAREWNKRKQEDFRRRSTEVKNGAELEALVAERRAHDIAYAKVVDGFNKAWAVIAQAKVTLPLVERGTDPKVRDRISEWISEALSFILQGKETLSAFGVQIGGGL